MRGLARYWRDELDRHPVLALWVLIFAVHLSMNFRLGLEIGGGGVGGFGFGLAILGFAGFGAFAADNWLRAHGAERAVLSIVVLLAVAIGQMAGWQSLGLTLAKGAGQMESKAEGRKSTYDALKGKRAERERIGTLRPEASIQAEETLECRRRSAQFPDGIGPACTKLRGELGSAKRAVVLDGEIMQLTQQLGAGSSVKDPNALYEVPQALFGAIASYFAAEGKVVKVGPDDVRFAWLVLLIFALEFIGIFGLAVVRGGGHDLPGGAGPHGAPPAGGPGRGPGSGGGGGSCPSFRETVQQVAGLLAPPPVYPALAAPGMSMSGGPPDARAEALWASGARTYMHGAPINIHFGNGAVPSVSLPSPQAVAASPPGDQPNRPRRDLEALPASSPPIDRSRVTRALAPEEREAADVLLAFRAACVVDTPGAVAECGNVFRRYQHWAGERALSDAAFLALFPDVTGVDAVEIAGVLHYRGVALRASPVLEAVA